MKDTPIHIEDLDLDSLERGQVHQLLLAIAHGASGAPMSIPIIVIRGKKEGPVFGVTAAIHGNELNGIPVIHRLARRIDPATLRGTIVAVVVVNIPGFNTGQRYLEGVDMNHIFPGKKDGNTPSVYAYRLIEKVIKRFDYLIDLHTASFGRANSLYIRADMTDPMTARMSYLQRPQIIVHNPASDYTLRGTAMELGIPAVTVEIGNPHRFQEKFIQRTVIGIRAVMAEVGMVRRRTVALGKPPILCERSYWIYSDHGGLLEVYPDVAEIVEEDTVIARVKDIWGANVRTFHAPQRGVIIGKSVNPVGMTGARVVQFGILAKPNDDRFLGRD